MLRLRPHHILDITRNIGNGREIKPHAYGHLLHLVTRELLDDIDQECTLVVGNDDICGPCVHLGKDGRCDDLLGQLSEPVSKQAYNDELDGRILRYLGLEPGATMRVSDYLRRACADLDGISEICTHPKEEKERRKEGLRKGLELLGLA
jgi:hypothetical protein